MSEHELFMELRQARKTLRETELRVKDARRARKEAEKTIEEILAQIDSGKTGRPILDAIAAAQGNGQGPNPTAKAMDEAVNIRAAAGDPVAGEMKAIRDRKANIEGDEPPSVMLGVRGGKSVTLTPESKGRGRKPKTERADRREVVISPDGAAREHLPPGYEGEAPADAPLCGMIQWTSEDLDDCLDDATHPDVERSSRWRDIRDRGCDDNRIVEVLRAIWPDGAAYTPPDQNEEGGLKRFGFTTKGGAVPKFWIGARAAKDQPPTLSGLALADRVRTVLDLPRVPAPPPAVTAADREPIRKRRKAVK